jgi:hypothetical protein
MKRQEKSESGQIIVIMAIAIVALLGFAALAIDVGMVYSDRRYDQSVADASALAAAQFIVDKLDRIHFTFQGAAHTGNGVTNPLCDNGSLDGDGYTTEQLKLDAMEKARLRAVSNNFSDYELTTDNWHGIDIKCKPNGDYEQYIDITSMITSETKTSFIHLLDWRGKLINTVTAMTRVYPRTATGMGFSIVAYKDTCFSNFNPNNGNNGEIFFAGGGNGKITLKGGGTHSNGCLGANGNAKVEVTDGGTNYFRLQNFVQPSGSGAYVTPDPQSPTSILKPPTVTIPCGKMPTSGVTDLPTGVTAEKNKWYSGIHLTGSGNTVTLESGGYYCISGDITIGGGTNTFNGTNVSIYMMNGSFKVTSSGASVNLVGPQTGTGHGLLLYTSPDNSCNLDTTVTNPNTNSKCVDIVGGNSQYYTGTILAPRGFISFNGNPTISCVDGNAYPTQIMGWMVQIGGTATMCLSYNMDDQLITPNSLGMQK